MKNGGGHFAPELGGHFELESGGHFELELGGQYDWNLHPILTPPLLLLHFSLGMQISHWLQSHFANRNVCQ